MGAQMSPKEWIAQDRFQRVTMTRLCFEQKYEKFHDFYIKIVILQP